MQENSPVQEAKVNQAGTIGEMLAEVSHQQGEAPLMLFGANVSSYASFDAQVDRLAAGLVGLGLRKGDRLGIMGLNQPEWLGLFFAAARLGLVIVGMSLRYRTSELRHILSDCKVRAVATIPEHGGVDFRALLAEVAGDLPDLRTVILLPDADGHTWKVDSSAALTQIAYEDLAQPKIQCPPGPMPDDLMPDDLMMVIYTSGTTGVPKGVGLSHSSMLAAARAQAVHCRFNSDDLMPVILPLNHVGGITCSTLTSICVGATIDLIPEFNAARMAKRIDDCHPTILPGVPTMLTLLMMCEDVEEIDFSSVRMIIVGGSNVDAALQGALKKRLPQAMLMNLFGLSETSGAIVMSQWKGTPHESLHALGKPIGGAQLRVVCPVTGEPVEQGETGELSFRGCGVMPGYVGQAALATGDALRSGWLRTGDLGLVDDQGVVYLRGRAKEMFIQGGFNIYPAEIESHILLLDDVVMVAGIGVADPVMGEIGRYYIVRSPGSTLDAETILDWCRRDLADYKVPRQIEFCDTLPLTQGGKIQKSVLVNQAKCHPDQ